MVVWFKIQVKLCTVENAIEIIFWKSVRCVNGAALEKLEITFWAN